ncbi:MAG: HRDC domain-containing protein [Desulfobacterales bacterium]|nr:HRDC domain-containing protein [Desulfobacterales bacterium]
MREKYAEPVKLINTPSDLAAAARHLAGQSVIAGDLEADSMFHFKERICLIQMAAPDMIYIIDPLAVTDMAPLKPVLENRDIRKIFHGADYDVRSLYRDFNISMQNLFDTELAGRFLGYAETGLNAMIKQQFDIELEKKFQKKDWSQRPLPNEMVTYAADDVRYLIALYEHLEQALQAKGRLEWAFEEFAHIAAVRPEPSDGRPLFLRCKGAGRLDPKSLTVLEALLEMRLEKARQKDRPPFKVMGTAPLIALAQARPKSMKNLESQNILSRRQIQMYGPDILRAIKTGGSVPADQRPHYPRNARQRPSAATTQKIRQLKRWREKEAKRLAIDPGVFFSNAQINALVEAVPTASDELDAIPALKKWQIREYGDQLIKIINQREKT